MTTEEIKKELHELYPNINGFIDHTLVAEMCLKWHELQLKKCNMPDVSESFINLETDEVECEHYEYQQMLDDADEVCHKGFGVENCGHCIFNKALYSR